MRVATDAFDRRISRTLAGSRAGNPLANVERRLTAFLGRQVAQCNAADHYVHVDSVSTRPGNSLRVVLNVLARADARGRSVSEPATRARVCCADKREERRKRYRHGC